MRATSSLKQPDNSFESGPDYVQSLFRGLVVIRAFGNHAPSMTLSEVAVATGLSRAVVRRQLLTLAHLGYVHQDGRLFSLTPRVLELGFSYLNALSYPELARQPMEFMSAKLQESCSMAILDGSDIVYVQRVSVRKVMTVTLNLGARLPAWCTSMGRVLLADRSDEAIAQWLAQTEFQSFTDRTCVDAGELLRRIAQVRADGYAYVEQELERGLCSLAVPLHNPRGAVVAALNVGMAYREEARERAIERVLPALQETAREIERIAGPHFPAPAREILHSKAGA